MALSLMLSGLLGLLGCPGFLHTVDQKHDLVEEAARAYVEGQKQKTLQQQVTNDLRIFSLPY